MVAAVLRVAATLDQPACLHVVDQGHQPAGGDAEAAGDACWLEPASEPTSRRNPTWGGVRSRDATRSEKRAVAWAPSWESRKAIASAAIAFSSPTVPARTCWSGGSVFRIVVTQLSYS